MNFHEVMREIGIYSRARPTISAFLVLNEIRLSNSIFIQFTNEVEVYKILNKLNINKVAGIDIIRPKDLRNNEDYISPATTNIINQSLKEGKIPKIIKQPS